MGLLLSSTSISKSFGIRPLFTGISISLSEGEHTGLIGPNGSGKSTLLKILAGIEMPDEGELTFKRRLRLAYLPQEDTFTAGTTLRGLLAEVVNEEHLPEHEQLTRINTILTRMGFRDVDQSVESLSGGWRKRLALARALVTEPDLLLLDEPTNHLDLEGILWLEKLLRSASFAFLLVSHDRYFLENATSRTVELNQAYPDGYFSVTGPYSQFLEKREEFLAAQASQQQALESRVRREVEWLRRGAKARTTKAKGRVEAAGRLMDDLSELRTRNTRDRSVAIDFTATERKTRKLAEAKAISKTLGGRILFSNLSFTLSPGQRLGLLGPNGSGKTTLIRLLTGELEPDAGQIRLAEGLRIVRFEQDRSRLDRRQTLRAALSPGGEIVTYRNTAMHISGWARRFLFRTEQLDMPVGDLSGGEQARILIARLMLSPADLLILDEPTNDLDIPTLEVLEESLEDFPGALVMVTHDRMMLDRLSTELLALDAKGGAQMHADLSQWERAQAAANETSLPRQAPAKAAAPAKALSKRLTYAEQREWEKMESLILVAEQELVEAQSDMANPATLADRDKLHICCQRVHDAQQRVEELYARWAELEDKQK